MTNRSWTFTVVTASLAVAATLGTTACAGGYTNDEDKAKPAADGKAAESKKDPVDKPADKAGDDEDATADEGGLADVVRDAIPDVVAAGDGDIPKLGVALGWAAARNPEEMLGKLQKQVLPPAYASYGNVETLRAMASMLGDKSALVQHLDFAHPLGCALIDDTGTKAPFACFFGYTGGATAASTDLKDGKQADAKGHVAYHIAEGENLYFDDLGSTVVVTTHADLFGKSKTFLNDTLLPYVKEQDNDVAMVAYPSALLKRYGADIAPLVSMMGPTGSGTLDVYKQIDSFLYAWRLDSKGMALHMDIGAQPDSDYASMISGMDAGPVSREWVAAVAPSTWAHAAYAMHLSKLSDIDMFSTMTDTMVTEYARETGNDATAIRTSLDAFVKETAELYGANVSFSAMHEPGTTGALVLVLQKEAPGREKWKTWSEGFTAEKVLGKDAKDDVSWAFKEAAVSVDGLPADRWTITAKKVADPDLKKVAKRFGGKLEMTVDRIELDHRVVFVASLTDADKNSAAAVAAAKGTTSLEKAPGGKAALDQLDKSAMFLALDLKRMFAWLAEIAPEGAPYPAVGNDLTDVLSFSSIESDRYDVDFILSQKTIDQLKGLIP